MTDTDLVAFDFDQWKVIAKTDPDRLEIMRKKLIDHYILQSGPRAQRRLRGLQWQIDQIRSISKTPMAACIRLSSMMWDTVIGEDGLLKKIQRLGASMPTQAPRYCKQAELVQVAPKFD